MPASLIVWSLNGGRFVGKSPEEEPQTLKWLKGLSEPGAGLPDVLCLQDFRVSLLQYLTPLPHFHFAAMTNHRIWGKRELTGIVIASRLPLENIDVCYTWGDGVIRNLEGVGADNQRIKPNDVADAMVLRTECRVAVAVTTGGLRIATHHGFWVRGGVATAEQLESTENLCKFLSEQSYIDGNVFYIADGNFDKDGLVMQRYLHYGATDYLPPDIRTTLPDTHPGAKFGAKPDRVMMFADTPARHYYTIGDVAVSNEPGSDHLLLKATISKE